MSSFEIGLIICFSLAPVVALLFIIPKRTKKEKLVEEKVKEVKEEKKQEKPVVGEIKEEPKEFKPSSELTKPEIQSYLDYKKQNVTKPQRIERMPNFATEDYLPPRLRRRAQPKKPETIAEEIQQLSPELKALIVAGVLDKKDFN